jgi:type IV secretion system protein VirB6
MDEAAPLTWLIGKITAIVGVGAGATATAIVTVITPLLAVCFSIYILLILFNYMRGAETEPVLDFGLRCAGFAVVLGLGLNAANYVSMVMPIITGLGGDLASAVGGGPPTSGALDELALHYLKIMSDGFEDASGFSWDIAGAFGTYVMLAVKCTLILLGLIPFLVLAAMILVLANVGSLLVAMVGPVFFGCLLFPATRQYFSAWVNTAVSYALIPLLVAVVASLSVAISKEMMSVAGVLTETSLLTVFLASLGNLTLLFLLKQVHTLASSLSAGGINTAMPGSIGTLANSIRSGVAGTFREGRGIAKAASGVGTGYRAVRARLANRNNSIRKAG